MEFVTHNTIQHKMTDQEFITLMQKSSQQRFMAAHQMLDEVSTDVLLQTLHTLLERAHTTKNNSGHCKQFANQIYAVLFSRGLDTGHLFVS
jgi:hypothetical protein